MKNFIISLSVFLIISILAITNAVILNEKATEMITALEALPITPDESKADEIIELWYRHERFFNLTANHAITDKIEQILCCLKNSEDNSTLLTARDTLLALLRDMKDSASISIDRIL